MKIKILGTALLIMLFIVSSNFNATAQSKYGKDSVECVKNLSLFGVYSKQDSYEDALKHWRYCFNQCPASSKALYINGAKMLKHFIDKNEDNKETYNLYVDTLMALYDKRIQYFGTGAKYGKAYALGRKGIDLLRYKKENVEESYGYLKESVKTHGKYLSYAVGVLFMQTSRQMFVIGKNTADDVINDFILVSDVLEKALKAEKKASDKEKYKTAITNCETIFAESGVADCKKLCEVFRPRYENNKNDDETLTKIVKFLHKNECTESQLYADVAESRYAINPSADAAADLAQVFAKRNNLEKAYEYYNKAVEKETAPELKADYYYKLALIAKLDKKYSDSRKYALQAAELKDNWGDPYILIATLYAETANSCGTDSDANIADFQRRAVYYVAVDKLTKARSIDPSVADDVKPLIGSYASRYPNSEKAFMVGYKAGQKYKVGCWIQETTTIRF